VWIDEQGELGSCWLDNAERREVTPTCGAHPLLDSVARRLADYFRGERVSFEEIPLPVASGFFVRCWEACRSIPPGATRSYRELAVAAGSTGGAARSAGQAMRRNPLPVIVPCHRVVASDGRLHGFGGDVDPHGTSVRMKRRLLELEGVRIERGVVRRGGTLFDTPV
jgi:methylated-DNA-[protein]-cysteine S-methyltransferase